MSGSRAKPGGAKPHRAVTDRVFSKIDEAVGQPAREELRREMQGWADRIQPRIDTLEAEMREMTAQSRSAEAQGALFVAGTTAAMDAMAAIHDRLDALESRMEFVRREILVEVRSQAGSFNEHEPEARTGPQQPVRPHLARTDWSPPPGSLRLNLGCGPAVLEGYVNVDMRDLPGVDLVADVHALPVAPFSVDEIHAAHILEHFTVEDARDRILPHWRTVLAREGILRVVVPDAEAMVKAYAVGEMSFDDLNTVLFGGQEYLGNDHHAMFNAEAIVDLLVDAGFTDVDVVATGRRNGACLELEVQARPGHADE